MSGTLASMRQRWVVGACLASIANKFLACRQVMAQDVVTEVFTSVETVVDEPEPDVSSSVEWSETEFETTIVHKTSQHHADPHAGSTGVRTDACRDEHHWRIARS